MAASRCPLDFSLCCIAFPVINFREHVTIDFDTLEDEAVTIRNRDTMEQERIKISELEAYIEKSLEF